MEKQFFVWYLFTIRSLSSQWFVDWLIDNYKIYLIDQFMIIRLKDWKLLINLLINNRLIELTFIEWYS